MLITLLTDFGTADYFVGAMKGVILSLNRDAPLVDISHEIPPHDILSGAFTLCAAYQNFPAGTIHVAVVDPGVGSARRPILISSSKQFLVGPDNGLFSFIYERETDVQVFHLTNEDYFRQPVSATFHGRDIFAPIAAALSMGVAPEKLGVEIQDYVRLPEIKPKADAGKLEASVIHIDRFGNCITSLTRNDISEEMIRRGVTLTINGREITTFRHFFAEGGGEQSEELFAIWGSAGFLEIAALRAPAARILDVRTGRKILVTGDE